MLQKGDGVAPHLVIFLTVLSSKYIVLLRKSMPIVAWYVLSNESYMKRVIKDVFPTDCSPKNTNLNFRRGLPKSPDVDILYYLSSEEMCFVSSTVNVNFGWSMKITHTGQWMT